MVEASLDWLDAVVANEALFDFDQLNLGLDALGTHNFNAALGAFWYICESRLLKRAKAHGLPVEKRGFTLGSKQVIKNLAEAGKIGSDQRKKLEEALSGRNALLHRGTEASQSITDKCLELASELLADVAPGLKAREPRMLFVKL